MNDEADEVEDYTSTIVDVVGNPKGSIDFAAYEKERRILIGQLLRANRMGFIAHGEADGFDLFPVVETGKGMEFRNLDMLTDLIEMLLDRIKELS